MARVLIVGAGAAGLMAAGAAVRQGHQVTVLEHTEKPGQKILVTGKGRCNVTNDCPAEEFLRHVRTNPRFLYSSLGAFPPAKTMELFEGLGVELKVERGRRVFPVSDKAEEIRQALLRYAQDADIVYDGAKKLLLEDIVPEAEPAPAVPENPRHPKKKKAGPVLRCVGVRGTSGREYRADAVLVATGGVSYPTTGSTGDGYRMAAACGEPDSPGHVLQELRIVERTQWTKPDTTLQTEPASSPRDQAAGRQNTVAGHADQIRGLHVWGGEMRHVPCLLESALRVSGRQQIQLVEGDGCDVVDQFSPSIMRPVPT